jgi:mannose-6-phosphate isomerase
MYAWGSPTALPQLLGTQPDGTPQAELWVGDHPAAPAVADGTPLNRLVAEHPDEVLGSRVLDRYGARLPFLLKVLAVERPLSLQVHPEAEQARLGYAADESAGLAPKDPARRYVDPHAKPELVVALTRFAALAGFRDPRRTVELLRTVPERRLQSIADQLESRPSAQGLRAVVEDLYARPDERIAAITSAFAALDVPPELRAAQRLCDLFPGDHGAVVALLLQHHVLEPGQALRVPPGIPHTYQRGLAVEVMAASDNVLRGGLTPKRVEVGELLIALVTDPAPDLAVRPIEVAPGVSAYPTGSPDFGLWRLRPAGADGVAAPGGGPRLLLCTDGAVEVVDPGGCVCVPRGGAALVPDAAGPVRVRGAGTVWCAGVGEPPVGEDGRP